MNPVCCSRPVILHANADVATESDCACVDPPREIPSTPRFLIGSARDYDRQTGMTESDCACAAPHSPAPAAVPLTTEGLLWRRAPGLHLMPLPAAQTLAFNPLRPHIVAVLNQPARQILESFALPAALSQAATGWPDGAPDEALQAGYRLAALGMIEPINAPVPGVGGEGSVLTAWLHVTNACNLRCTYCYVAKTAEAMDEATGLTAVDAIIRSAMQHGFRTIKLKYAGGEATLNFRLIRLLHAYAREQSAVHGLALQELILSNGVGLHQAMLDFIRDAGIRLMISLDGLGSEHDAQRPLANGAPSAALVQRTIQRACENGLRPHISITVTPANAASLADTVRFLMDYDLRFNLNFVREVTALSSRGNPAGDWENEMIAGILQALAVIEDRLPRYRLIDGLLDRASFAGAHNSPCGAGSNYLVVNQQGKIAPCHMALAQPVGDIWEDDPLSVVRQAWSTRYGEVAERQTACSSCMWRNICRGGCPLLAQPVESQKGIPARYCKVYRAILPELLRLEGLRLLKWQGG